VYILAGQNLKHLLPWFWSELQTLGHKLKLLSSPFPWHVNLSSSLGTASRLWPELTTTLSLASRRHGNFLGLCGFRKRRYSKV